MRDLAAETGGKRRKAPHGHERGAWRWLRAGGAGSHSLAAAEGARDGAGPALDGGEERVEHAARGRRAERALSCGVESQPCAGPGAAANCRRRRRCAPLPGEERVVRHELARHGARRAHWPFLRAAGEAGKRVGGISVVNRHALAPE